MNIGNRIKRLREDANLTQRQLAASLGCSPGLVGQWESHRKDPGRDNLKRLADALGTNMEFLLRGAARQNGVHITDPYELLMLRRFRNLTPRQRENILELLGVSGDVRRQIENKR
jgi:transcriptional regulator with XRE-family HTH domain